MFDMKVQALKSRSSIQRKCSCGGTCSKCAAKVARSPETSGLLSGEPHAQQSQQSLGHVFSKVSVFPSVQRFAQGGLQVSEPSDPAELEAESIAERLFPSTGASPAPHLEHSAPRELDGGAVSGVSASTSAPMAQREAAPGGAGASCPTCASESLNGIVATSGSPLPERTRAEMENAFGTDFSGVRIHADGRAAKLSRSLNAQAFTYGNDIFFDSGKYDPESQSGKRLLAHELTHTVQQRGTLAMLSREGGGRTALQCVNDNLASMGVAAWLITIVGGACALVGALAGSPTGPGAAGTAAFGAALCIAGLTGLSIGMVSRVIRECIRDPNVRVGLPGTLAAAPETPAERESAVEAAV